MYNIKPKFQQLLRPVLTRLHTLGVSANQITWTSILLSLAIGIAFWFAAESRILFWALPVGLFARMALNALDGMMARVYNQQSKSGELLNEAGDIISDLFIYFPLLRFEQANMYLIVLFICGSIVNEFAGLLGKVISGVRRYEGPMGKSDRAFLIGLYGIASWFQVITPERSFWVFVIADLLLILSTSLRLKKSL